MPLEHVTTYQVRAAIGSAASWSARLASANRFLARSFEETQPIRAGLRRPDGSPKLATIIDEGPIRGYALTATPDGSVLTVTGFDRSRLLIEQWIRRLYRRSLHGTITVGGSPIDLPMRELPNLTGDLPITVERPGIISQATPVSGELPVTEGRFTNRAIAEDICRRKNVPLAWQAPEHEWV